METQAGFVETRSLAFTNPFNPGHFQRREFFQTLFWTKMTERGVGGLLHLNEEVQSNRPLKR